MNASLVALLLLRAVAPPPEDTTPPMMNGAITVSAITSSGFTLSWSAGSDNTAVTGYEVSIDGGTSYTNIGNVLTVTETGLTASTLYNNKVRAYDAAGNQAIPLSATATTSTVYVSPTPVDRDAHEYFIAPMNSTAVFMSAVMGDSETLYGA